MFTGIIEEQGQLVRLEPGSVSARMTFAAQTVLSGTRIGDSIAVNGVCLTVTRLHSGTFCADVMAESLRRSNLGGLKPGAPVNLERALLPDTRLGGHLVSGHIDGTGVVTERRPEGNAVWFRIRCAADCLAGMVPKGSVAIDGISLTLVSVDAEAFTVSIIPHTMAETTLGRSRPGTVVNLETDIIGKYVRRYLSAMLPGGAPPGQPAGLSSAFPTELSAGTPGTGPSAGGIDLDSLRRSGFL